MPKWEFIPTSDRSEYFHKRHLQERKLRRFAHKVGMTPARARAYLDKKLKRWYAKHLPKEKDK